MLPCHCSLVFLIFKLRKVGARWVETIHCGLFAPEMSIYTRCLSFPLEGGWSTPSWCPCMGSAQMRTPSILWPSTWKMATCWSTWRPMETSVLPPSSWTPVWMCAMPCATWRDSSLFTGTWWDTPGFGLAFSSRVYPCPGLPRTESQPPANLQWTSCWKTDGCVFILIQYFRITR